MTPLPPSGWSDDSCQLAIAGYTPRMAKLLDAIRREIEASGQTRYRIAKESGVSAGQLSRLVNGERGLSVDSLERLAEYLGLRIKIERKRTTKGQ